MSIFRYLIFFLPFILIPLGAFAQQPLNFSFEKRSVEDRRPWGWASTSWGPSVFGIDSSTVKNGSYSLRARCEEQCEAETYQYAMEPFELRGKNVSLNGFVKGSNIQQPFNISIGYAYFADDGISYLQEEIFSDDYVETFDWTVFSITAQIPSTVKLTYININMNGEGTAWVDNMELLIDGQKHDQIRVNKAFTPKEIQWFQDNTTPFSSPLPSEKFSEEDARDLAFFRNAVGNSQIVALGEATHGTHEFFTLKHKLLQYAVEEMGFRVFAIEDHQLIVRNVDNYIKTGEGDARKSMAGMFGVWSRQEVLDMIEWLRKYNLQHPDDMVSCIGFDIQDVNPSIRSLESFLSTQDTTLLTEIKPILVQLKEYSQKIFFVQDTLEKQGWVDEAMLIHKRMTNKKEGWLLNASSEQEKMAIHYGVQYAKLIYQFFQEGLHNGQMLYRDEAMAENLSWYLNNIQPAAKVVIWAHDVHVSQGRHPITEFNMHGGKSMGHLLKKKYQDDYKSFSLSTYTGTYRAFKTYAYQELIECPLLESPEGTIEEVLHQISIHNNRPNLYLSLSNAEAWLYQPVPVRFANHVSFDYSFWPRFVIPDQFDGMFFIDNTSSSILFNSK